ncbi:hypothetical protein MJO28_007159 [Puccinia striiformis f. sp. tritici]|uniref:Uncharacterized protein n=1 Tax=Puccinia striiformis f. sp. tritici TaxID=168172 RepID=A0ACC0EEL2_9BASI|nr:hypothetical protein MJO28_007159 [Puccinia striiformis f. sp. tritici]
MLTRSLALAAEEAVGSTRVEGTSKRLELLGYIPISLDDPNYLLERKREDDDGLDECHCSNCDVEKFKAGLS